MYGGFPQNKMNCFEPLGHLEADHHQARHSSFRAITSLNFEKSNAFLEL